MLSNIRKAELILLYIQHKYWKKKEKNQLSLNPQVLLRVFSFLKHAEMMKYSVVSKKWRMIAQDSRLWGFVSLRPEISGLHIQSQGSFHIGDDEYWFCLHGWCKFLISFCLTLPFIYYLFIVMFVIFSQTSCKSWSRTALPRTSDTWSCHVTWLQERCSRNWQTGILLLILIIGILIIITILISFIIIVAISKARLANQRLVFLIMRLFNCIASIVNIVTILLPSVLSLHSCQNKSIFISIFITQVSESQYYLQYYDHTGVQISLTYFWISPMEHNLQTSQSLTPSPQRFSTCKIWIFGYLYLFCKTSGSYDQLRDHPNYAHELMRILVSQIKYLCMCLSETIFLDNFMKKIYNFINGIEMLHLYGTYEQGEEEEGEVYEVLNIRSVIWSLKKL